jgi:hypothetical protein
MIKLWFKSSDRREACLPKGGRLAFSPDLIGGPSKAGSLQTPHGPVVTCTTIYPTARTDYKTLYQLTYISKHAPN